MVKTNLLITIIVNYCVILQSGDCNTDERFDGGQMVTSSLPFYSFIGVVLSFVSSLYFPFPVVSLLWCQKVQANAMLGNLNKEYDRLYIIFCWLDTDCFVHYKYVTARFIWEYGNGWEALHRLPD